uniref:Phosphoesterase n=1 Tax=mine drainage metagenome TaxID=410659 RepID=E6QU79_9ZZZZ
MGNMMGKILHGCVFVLAAALANVANFCMASEVPSLNHVYLIVMENHSYQDIIGNSNAPYINEWLKTANLATDYFAVGHPSLPNYLELVGGSNFGIRNDDYPDWHGATPSSTLNQPLAGTGMDLATPPIIAPFGVAIASAPYRARTIADQLSERGKRWKSYQESLPASGLVDGVNDSDGIYTNLDENRLAGLGPLPKHYAAKHNPFVYFAVVQEGKYPHDGLGNVVGFDGAHGLYADLGAGISPALSFIVPNLCHDMHGINNGSKRCGNDIALVQMGDATVRQLVEAIHASPAWKIGHNALILVWDENSNGADPNRVALVVETNYGKQGLRSPQPYSHFSLLKTLEAGFGLPCLNHACDHNVHVISDLFAAK